MKILHFIYDHIYNPWIGGGGAIRVYNLNKFLERKGYDITIVSGKFPNIENYSEKNMKFEFIGFSGNSYIASIFLYLKKAIIYLKKNFHKYDIIIEDFSPWNPIFSYKFQNNKPIILSIQNYIGKEIIKKYNIFGMPFYLIEKNYPKNFNNIIVLSNILNSRFSIKGKVISQGINIDDNFTLNVGNYIGFLGRIDIYQKGIDLIVKAAKFNPNYQIVIAGEGKEKNKFLKKINLLNNIKYIGKVVGQEKKEFLFNAKFMIMPSRFEGQGIVAIEAAAMGKPLIVSDIPELNYVVENGFGISFKSGDWKDLKNKIEFLWNNENLIMEMGKKGREYAKKFTWDKIAEEYENYLIEVYNNFHKLG